MKPRRIPLAIGAFVLAMIAWTYPTSRSQAEATCPDSAQQFWQKFRQEAIRGNVRKIVGWTRFPFDVKSTLDDDKRKQVGRDAFVELFPRLLAADPGLGPTPSTMKSLVGAAARLSPAFCSASRMQFRVGDWVFEAAGQEWQFVRAFLDE